MTNTLNRAQGDTITTADWQTAVESVEFPAYSYDFVGTRTYGGVLDINRYAKAGWELASVASYRTRFLDYKDIRSNYYQAVRTAPPVNTWTDYASGSTMSKFNNYSSANQTARLAEPAGASYDVTTSANGIYLIYGEFIVPVLPTNVNIILRLLFEGNVVAYFSQSGTLQIYQSCYFQGQHLSAYKGGTYTLQYYIDTAMPSTAVTFRFGYAELIGNASGCGQ